MLKTALNRNSVPVGLYQAAFAGLAASPETLLEMVSSAHCLIWASSSSSYFNQNYGVQPGSRNFQAFSNTFQQPLYVNGTAGSGDEVQASLVETGPDTGIFRAVVASP